MFDEKWFAEHGAIIAGYAVFNISVQSMVSFMVKTKVVDHFIVVYFLSLFLVQNRI